MECCDFCIYFVTESVDAPPKTFTTKDKFEYFKPSVQVEMDNPDKPDTVNEIFIRGERSEKGKEYFQKCFHFLLDLFLKESPTSAATV